MLLTGASLCARAEADPAVDFTRPQPARRLALVVGNAEYETVTRLPGAVVDAERIDSVLRSLGFTTHLARNVKTREEFLQLHFLPFVDEVREGDVVVFYFSGHGFSSAGESYITPLHWQLAPDKSIFHTFLSTTALHDLINSKDPGLLLMFLDACRNIRGLSVKAADGREMVAKGLAEMRSPARNSVISYAADIGKESFGSEDAISSYYTTALANKLPTLDRDFDAVKRIVRRDVVLATRNQQVPWSSESNSEEFYFRPSDRILDQFKQLWLAALGDGTRLSVKEYLMSYGTGPYGAAARQWLAMNPDAPEQRTSIVSAAGPEALWNMARFDLRLLKFDGALRPESVASDPTGGLAEKLRRSAQVPIAGSLAGWSNRVDDSYRAGVLSTLGHAITANFVDTRASPSLSSVSLGQLQPGQPITVAAVERDEQDNVWLKGMARGSKTPFYVLQAEAKNPLSAVDIGKPAVEIDLKPSAAGLKGMVDVDPLRRRLESLRASGRSVTWASISTSSFAVTKDAAAFDSLRAMHVRAVLSREGVSREQITTIEGVHSKPGQIRVRLFTN